MTQTLLSGNQAVAEAARRARVGVIAAYPITPQTTIIEHLADLIARGGLDADYITVESEHSAMAASIGASLGGSRTFTATSSQGLALMHEMLHWASGQRLPIVMANVNRALAPPWSVWADHTDSMAQRDTGWIQLYAEDNQEAFDLTLQAFRLAEDARVSLPVMMMLDGFLLSHTYMPVDMPSQADVDAWLAPYRPLVQVEPRATQLFGSFSPPDQAYTEFKRDVTRGMDAARALIPEISADYGARFGRPARGLVDEYRTEGAEAVLVAMGSVASTARDAVDALRAEGLAVGLARVRAFRPFPALELRDLAGRVDALGVVDRAVSHGAGGPLATEIRASLAGMPDAPDVASVIAGLGGRDVRPDHLTDVLRALLAGTMPRETWLGLKAEVV